MKSNTFKSIESEASRNRPSKENATMVLGGKVGGMKLSQVAVRNMRKFSSSRSYLVNSHCTTQGDGLCKRSTPGKHVSGDKRFFASTSMKSKSIDDTNKRQEQLLEHTHEPLVPFPLSPTRTVPPHIVRPPYAETGQVPLNLFPEKVLIHDEGSIVRMRNAARLAREMLDYACSLAHVGTTTDEIDAAVHEAILSRHAYPSPLNYVGFPKSLCSSINEVICHGIPDTRPLQFGDVVSFDVSCYIDGVHGDNCATIIVGDVEDEPGSVGGTDFRNLPYLVSFSNEETEQHFLETRRLVQATRESLHAAIDTARPGSCLSDIGDAIQTVAESEGFSSVEKYRGHGIAHQFHCAPYVKHFRNADKLELKPGMIFTIEPMLTQGSQECFEWDDEWTVATRDGKLAAQFEHTILITDSGNEILTVLD